MVILGFLIWLHLNINLLESVTCVVSEHVQEQRLEPTSE